MRIKINYRKIRLFYRNHKPDYIALLALLFCLFLAGIAGRFDFELYAR